MTVTEILEQAQSLNLPERKELVKLLIDTLDSPPSTARRLSEIRGLGKEIWVDVDVQTYIDQMRDEWDQHS